MYVAFSFFFVICIIYYSEFSCLFFIFPFQGGKIRSKLGAELSGADGVVIEEGTAGEGGKEAAQRGMRK